MIKTNRQYRVAKIQVAHFARTLSQLTERRKGRPSPILDSQIASVQGELSLVESDAREYEALISGRTTALRLQSLSDLPGLLVKARIAAGLTQAELAATLGLKEQQIQRYEAMEYAGASMRRMLEVADALNLSLPPGLTVSVPARMARYLQTRLKQFGLSPDFIARRLTPPGSGEGARALTESGWASAAEAASRIFGLGLDVIMGSEPVTYNPVPVAAARFKLPARFHEPYTAAYSLYAYYLACTVVRAVTVNPRPVPRDPAVVRESLLRSGGMTLEAALRYAWSLGVVVIPLDDPGAFHGAYWRIGGQDVIILKQRTSSQARWLFDLIHELGHASEDAGVDDRAIIEPGDFVASYRDDPAEGAASAYAGDVILGSQAESIAQRCVSLAQHEVPRLKKAVQLVAADLGVDTGLLSNYMAYRLSLQGLNWWGTAANLQPGGGQPFGLVRDMLLLRIDSSRLDHIDAELLIHALEGGPDRE